MFENSKNPGSAKQAAAPPPASEQVHGTIGSGTGDTSLAPGQASLNAAGPAPQLLSDFGRYKIIRSLGKGAMGIVYLAEDTQLKRQVALKVPQLDSTTSGTRLERFYREARLAATLRHANLCPIFDVGEFEGIHFISMAYIEGKSLDALLKSGMPQSERAAASIMRKVAMALQEAHSHGVIHRDLKPGNIMIDRQGEPIVMDFGLARQVGSTDQAQITHSGAIIGTPSYMSPEQVQGQIEEVGAASDVYSLGVILYQLLTGRLPFQGPVVSVLAQIATQTPAPPSSYRDKLSPELEAICLQAMAKRPKDRFASMADLAAALMEFLRKRPAGVDQSQSNAAAPSQASVNTPSVVSGASPAGAGSSSAIPGIEARAPIGTRLVSFGRTASARVRLAAACAGAVLVALGVIIVIKSRDGADMKVTVAGSGDETLITVEPHDANAQNGPGKTKQRKPARADDSLRERHKKAGRATVARDYYWSDGPATQWHPVRDAAENVIVGGAPALSADNLEIVFWRAHPAGFANGRSLFLARRLSLGEPFGKPAQIEAIGPDEYDSAPTLADRGLTLYFRRSPTWPPTIDVAQTLMRAQRPNRDSAFSPPQAVEHFPGLYAGGTVFSPDGTTSIYHSVQTEVPHRAVRRKDGSFEIQPTNLPVMIPNVQSAITLAAISNAGNVMFTQDIDASVWLFLSRTRGGADEYETPERLLNLQSPTRNVSVVALSQDAGLLFSHDNGDELIVMRLPEATRLKIVDALDIKAGDPSVASSNSPEEPLLTDDDSSAAEHTNADSNGAEAEPASTPPDDSPDGSESAKDRPSPSRKPARRPAVPDVFPVNSVWRGTMRQSFADNTPVKTFDFTVTVNERSKNGFKATVAVGDWLVYEVDGRIRQNTIEWNTADARIRKGTAGLHQYSGKIVNGNRLELRFSGTTPSLVGTSAIGSAVLQEPE